MAREAKVTDSEADVTDKTQKVMDSPGKNREDKIPYKVIDRKRENSQSDG
ncbi:hypothetical protein [Lysinibacillus fusiformis]